MVITPCVRNKPGLVVVLLPPDTLPVPGISISCSNSLGRPKGIGLSYIWGRGYLSSSVAAELLLVNREPKRAVFLRHG